MCPETETASRVRVRGATSTPAPEVTPIVKRSHPLEFSGQTATMRNPFRRSANNPAPVAPKRELTPAQYDRLEHVLGVMSTAGLVDLTAISMRSVAEAAAGELDDDPLGFDVALGALIIASGNSRQPTNTMTTTNLWSEIPDEDVVAMARRICLLHGVDPSLEIRRDQDDLTAGSLRIGLDPPAEIRVTIPGKGIPDGVAEGLAPLLADTIAPGQLMNHLGGVQVHAVLTPEQASLVNDECGASFYRVLPAA